MKNTPAVRGRPRTSRLSRREQLRLAKQAQRQRERRAGLTKVELHLPADQARRLRIAMHTPGFKQAFGQFLQDMVLDITMWPKLRELAWNRAERWIPAQEALALYERNWRFVEGEQLTREETNLVEHLRDKFGGGVLNV